MKYLLDTHAFLWWIDDSPRLSAEARRVIGDGRNQIFFSAASGWEIAVKCRLGKLELPRVPGKYIPEQVRLNDFQVMPVELSHARVRAGAAAPAPPGSVRPRADRPECVGRGANHHAGRAVRGL